jgi:hypothetical protein
VIIVRLEIFRFLVQFRTKISAETERLNDTETETEMHTETDISVETETETEIFRSLILSNSFNLTNSSELSLPV